MGWLAMVLFFLIFLLILRGYPVAFTLGGLSVVFAFIVIWLYPQYLSFSDLRLLPFRIMGVISNYVLIAVPLFIFMGIMLEKSGLAESLLETMASLFGNLPGGLAVSVIIVGALLAASTGIVGATVVTMGLISLPTMLKKGYSAELATGTIASSGTLGQIIPPSIVLVLLADTMSSSAGTTNIDVGSMFSAALIPGCLLVLMYIIYVLVYSNLYPEKAPAFSKDEVSRLRGKGYLWKVIKAFLLPMLLILAVLGSIFTGLASPTEAAAVGAFGAILLTILQGKFSMKILREVMQQTTHLSSMVFMILLGATTFTLIFKSLHGDDYLIQLITQAELSSFWFLVIVMLVIFVAGFFIDFIEIIFILVPVVTPIFVAFEMDLIWVGILIALNLQTSFLTPPFGFSLFYLKGVAPPEVSTHHIYKGIIPFIIIQVLFLLLIIAFPSLVHLLD